MKIRDINYSYSVIEIPDTDEGLDLRLKLMNILSVYVDGYRFTPSFRAGMWDGKKKFYSQTPSGMIIPRGLVRLILDKFPKFEYENIDSNDEKVTEEEIREFIKKMNYPFGLRDYQIKAIVEGINNKNCILISATGSGKSAVISVLLQYFLSKGLKGALIVPTVNLVEQMYSDFIDYGWNNVDELIHKIYSGKEKEFNKNIILSTWQSLKNALHLLPKADFLIIDEAHSAKADVLDKIIKASVNARYKIGLTGTLPQNTIDKFTLLSTLGKPITIITPQELINQGYATPVEIVMFFLNYNKEICKEFWQVCKTYQQEVKYIEELKLRNVFISKIVNKLSNKKENNLILYNKIAHGETLLKEIVKLKLNLDISNDDIVYKKEIKTIKDNTKYYLVQSKNLIKDGLDENIIALDDLNIFFIRGDVKGDKREEIRKMFELQDGGILIATYGTLSTGVNIKKIHNIHLASSIKSFITLNQSIGRGMRQHETKDKVRIWDYVDDFTSCRKKKNYILKHADERINLYLENAYPIIEKEIQLGY